MREQTMFEKCRTCADFERYESDDGKTAYCLKGREIGKCDMMDLESAIQHCQEVVFKELENTKGRNATDPYAKNCMQCAEDHRQLAGWLKELIRLRAFKNSIERALPQMLTTEYEAYVYHKILETDEEADEE